MNSIGGYFELELPRGKEYHNNAIKLNTGRNAFEYILRAKQYEKVYLPYYTCEVMLEPINKLNLEYQFYSIDKQFRPIFNFSVIENNAVFVYTNYFGLCDNVTDEVSLKCKNLIIDNSQAFYSKPLDGVDTFYSARKFFGVPDGAYLYTDNILETPFEMDESFTRVQHLLGRLDKGAEAFYAEYKKNDLELSNLSIRQMANLTQRILSGVDYASISTIRKANFNFLHVHLSKNNELNLEMDKNTVPMIYPFFIANGNIVKNILIRKRVFVPTFWPELLSKVAANTVEFNFANNIICLPVDQRYNTEDMEIIINYLHNVHH